MNKLSPIIWGSIFIFLMGCATPGQKFIDIAYNAGHEKIQTGQIGIAPFQDKRKNQGQGYIGYRILLDNSQETYLVKGLDLADTLTKVIKTYFKKNGFSTTPIDQWERTPDGVEKVLQNVDKLFAGQINTFECRAKKKGLTTDMVLDIDLTLYLGMTDTNILKTIPVNLAIQRTELTFTQVKLEHFINTAIEEIVQKAFEL